MLHAGHRMYACMAVWLLHRREDRILRELGECSECCFTWTVLLLGEEEARAVGDGLGPRLHRGLLFRRQQAVAKQIPDNKTIYLT